MKKLTLFVAFALVLINVQAQSPATNGSALDFEKSTAVKVNPLSLVFGKIGLLGEYNFRHKKSFTFAVGIPVEMTNSFLKLNGRKRDIQMKTFSAMGGYRMYLGKKSMSGFYLEPFVKYVKSEGVTNLDETVNNKNMNFLVRGEYTGFGAGAQLGVQFLIGKSVTFDLFILGPEANMTKAIITSTETTNTGDWTMLDEAEARRQIQDELADIPIIGKKIKVSVNGTEKTVTSSYSGFAPGFRAGLSLGVRF